MSLNYLAALLEELSEEESLDIDGGGNPWWWPPPRPIPIFGGC